MECRVDRRVLFCFGFHRLEPMLEKGNVWYVRHYERYFDEVHILYLRGDNPSRVTQGSTNLVSLGSPNRWLDLFFAPVRLLRYVRTQGAGRLLTADTVFGWWTASLARIAGYPVVLMPVCIPEDIYRDSGKSLSGLPIPLERLMIRFTFLVSHTVLTGRCFGSFVDWLSSCPWARNKLIVVDSLPDALPSPGFLAGIDSTNRPEARRPYKTLIYVGRLHKEKLVHDLIYMMQRLAAEGINHSRLRLVVVGDGPERESLMRLAQQEGVGEMVIFLGALPNEDIPKQLMGADVFVSPLTGTSLREAALCGLPIVAYERDWLSGLLRHEETALLVPSRDVEGMARQVRRLLENPDLSARLANASHQLAERLWSVDAVATSLAELDAHLPR